MQRNAKHFLVHKKLLLLSVALVIMIGIGDESGFDCCDSVCWAHAELGNFLKPYLINANNEMALAA